VTPIPLAHCTMKYDPEPVKPWALAARRVQSPMGPRSWRISSGVPSMGQATF
jgi:hypothetical protein